MTENPRYSRQALYAGIGKPGQARLAKSRAAIVGLGALGAAAADTLARAGVGTLRIIDRDILELTNLQRQILYSEQDIKDGLPKAKAAHKRLSLVNSEIEIESVVSDVTAVNIDDLLDDDFDIIVDGTDNFETRLLINDVAMKKKIPWVYCGVIGASIHSFPILPGETPCFRCYIGEAPPPGSVDTCDTAGVLGPAVLVAVGLACVDVLKILAGKTEALVHGLQMVDLWAGRHRRFGLKKDSQCPACLGQYDYLDGKGRSAEARLCGRNAVQIHPGEKATIDLKALAERLSPLGVVEPNPFLLRFRPADWPEGELTIFPDGRSIIKGTNDLSRARSVLARFLGS
ncbi:MAG: ThiF family adenylyltransferase [Planctomycetota bacterium]|nr:ThiF family adenylyltransferase [Planctomycetota bacterium]